jgi:hypothetical protein
MVQASPRLVSPSYFAVLGVPVLAGRVLHDSDTLAAEPAVVVNETFARRYLPDGALGAHLPMSTMGQGVTGQAVVIGVVGDVRYVGAKIVSLPEMYFSYRQVPVGLRSPTVTLMARGARDPRAFADGLRAIANETEPAATLGTVMTIEERLLTTSLARPRLYAAFLAAFALVAIVVSGVGLFGSISYAMAQRSRELALRSALGASRARLVSLVIGQGLTAVGIGLVAGLVASRWAAGLTASVLFGVSTGDAVTYVAVPAAIAVVAAAACAGPALRAWRLDPIRALRGEQ